MKKILAIILSLALLVPSTAAFADIQKNQNSLAQTSTVTVTKGIERSSEYQYVQALATQKNISYELANKLNTVENAKILKTSNNISLRSAPEVITLHFRA